MRENFLAACPVIDVLQNRFSTPLVCPFRQISIENRPRGRIRINVKKYVYAPLVRPVNDRKRLFQIMIIFLPADFEMRDLQTGSGLLSNLNDFLERWHDSASFRAQMHAENLVSRSSH